jgi:hypothetical protein
VTFLGYIAAHYGFIVFFLAGTADLLVIFVGLIVYLRGRIPRREWRLDHLNPDAEPERKGRLSKRTVYRLERLVALGVGGAIIGLGAATAGMFVAGDLGLGSNSNWAALLDAAFALGQSFVIFTVIDLLILQRLAPDRRQKERIEAERRHDLKRGW